MNQNKFINRRFLFFFIAVIPFLVMRLQYINFVPLWDGYNGYRLLLEAIDYNKVNGLQLEMFNIGHLSFLYMFYLAIGQLLDFGNPVILNIQILLLSVVSLYCFYELLNFFFKNSKLENALGVLLLSLNPFFIATSINYVNIEYPSLLFFICFMYGIVYRNKPVLLVSSLFMIFTNFSGVFLFIITFFFLFIYSFICKTNLKEKLKKTTRFLIIPLSTLCVYYTYNYFFYGVVSDEQWTELEKSANNLFLDINMIVARLVQIFVLNYQWILTIFIIAFGIYYFYFKKDDTKISFLSEKKVYLLLVLTQFILLLLGFLKNRTWTNPRYIVSSIFFTTFLFYYSINKFFNKKRIIKILIIIFSICLFAFQNFNSLDPVSNLIYGNFKFGKTKMYKMVSITKEGVGIAGRDQLVYNTQFSNIGKLVNKLYQNLSKKDNDFLIIHNYNADYYLFTKYSKDTKKRTLKNSNYIDPKTYPIWILNFMISNDLLHTKKRMYYVNLPWLEHKENDIKRLVDNFHIGDEQFIVNGKYSLSYFELVPKK